MATRDTRRAHIKRLVQQHQVASQAELVDLLCQEGVICTQATLSRDLRSMGIVRRATPSGPAYALDHTRAYAAVVRQVVAMEITRVEHNGSLIVVRTLPGRAQGVAAFIDSWNESEILGTVAGDDTIFVSPRDLSRTAALAERIAKLEAAKVEEGT